MLTFCVFQGEQAPGSGRLTDPQVLGMGPVNIETVEWDGGLKVTWSSQLPAARFAVEIVDPARGVPVARTASLGATTWTFAVTRDELPAGSIVRVYARSRGREEVDEAVVPR